LKTLRQKDTELIALVGEEEARKKLHHWYDTVLKRLNKRNNEPSGDEVIEFCRKVLEDLHRRTGFTYKMGRETKSGIIARKNDGYDLQDFFHVHEVKVFHWLDDVERRNNLHPSTLYRPKNFDRYLIQWQMRDRDIKRKEAEKNRKKIDEQKETKEHEITPEEAAEYREKVHGILGKFHKRVPKLDGK
jgi:uncharacterized phage protein (TIGR02220 family)